MTPNFKDIPTSFLIRVANAFQEGKEKYEKNYPPLRKNYVIFTREQALKRIDNLIDHVLKLRDHYSKGIECDPIEDDLGHAAANLAMLAEWEKIETLDSTLPSKKSCDFHDDCIEIDKFNASLNNFTALKKEV